jgi:RHS repeat-associated protein
LQTGGSLVGRYYRYYAYGETKNEQVSMNQVYKYTGKPLDTEKGLNLYYFGARYYNPAIGRWLAVDPLACTYPERSSYEFCAGNPIRSIDIDGRKITNPGHFVLSNPYLIQVLGRFDQEVSRLSGVSSSDYEFRISGGDRNRDEAGSIRSLSNGSIVRNSVSTSFHLQTKGALAADLIYPSNKKITKSIIEKAAAQTGLRFVDTYADNHFHLQLQSSYAKDYLSNWRINRLYRPTDEAFTTETRPGNVDSEFKAKPGQNEIADYFHSIYPNYIIIVNGRRYY